MNIRFNIVDIKINLRKVYYKYIHSPVINHYKLLLLTEEYRNITNNYFDKYPTATAWINLNKTLFDSNKQAEIDFLVGSINQTNIKNEFFKNREIICKNCKNKEYIICSNSFQKKYLQPTYRFEENIENIINDIMSDIRNNEKK